MLTGQILSNFDKLKYMKCVTCRGLLYLPDDYGLNRLGSITMRDSFLLSYYIATFIPRGSALSHNAISCYDNGSGHCMTEYVCMQLIQSSHQVYMTGYDISPFLRHEMLHMPYGDFRSISKYCYSSSIQTN
jgi:hypothetical protein